VALLFFTNGFVVGSWLPRLPEIRDRLGIDLAALGITLAVGSLGSLVGSAMSGTVVARFGARRSALVSAVGLYLILPLISVAPTALALAAVLAVIGLLDGQVDVGMNAIGIRVEESVGRSIMTRLHGLWSLGTLLGAGAASLSILWGIGLQTQLLVVAAIGLIAVGFAARLTPHTEPRIRVGQRSGALAVGLILAGATAVIIEGAPFDWSAIFLRDVTGAAEAAAGAGVICYTAGMLCGRMGGDRLVDSFGSVRTVFAGLAVATGSMLIVVTSGPTVVALIGFAAWGLAISVVLPILYKLAGSHPGFSEGSGLAALTVGTRLGFMAAPALIGVAATSWGLPAAIGVVVGAAAVASAVSISLTLARAEPVRDSLP
jgi:predicted MFS family arabinose efflux permease